MKKKNQIEDDNFGVNLNRALRFLSIRPRSEKEIQDYLKKKQVDLLTSQKIIDKLKENKFLDDFEFAKWWIDQRTRIKPRASKLIKFELKQKGISDEIIKNSELKIENDFENALVLAKKRMQRYKNHTPQKIYEKMGRFLSSKGFDYHIIKKVIEKVLSKGYNNNG